MCESTRRALKAMAEFPKEIEVEVKWMAAILKPGDTLVVGINQRLSQQQAADAYAAVKREIPDNIDVVVIESVGSMVVYRPDPETSDEPL